MGITCQSGLCRLTGCKNRWRRQYPDWVEHSGQSPGPRFAQSWSQSPVHPPGRPVVAGIGCLTEKISQFVDHFLNPISKKVKSYVQDTNDFIRQISSFTELPEGRMLVTMDVTSLYTNIPNREGLRARMRALDTWRRVMSSQPT